MAERWWTGWWAALVPIAAVVGMDPAGWFPFGPVKWVAVAIMVVAALASVVTGRRVVVPFWPAVVWCVLLVLVMVSAATAIDTDRWWLGTLERHWGVLAWLLFACSFVVGANLGRRGRDRLVDGMVVAGLVCGAYSLVELLWRQPIRLDAVTERLGGPFGSAAYLGAAVCLLLPVCVVAALQVRRGAVWRACAAVAAALLAVAVVGSGSRGAWLGLCVAGVVAVVRRRDGRVLALAAVVLAIGTGVVALAGRVGDVVDRASPVSARWDEWRVAAAVIGERPALGAGPDGYRYVAGDGIDAAYERRYGRQVVTDRAHSAPLDVAAASGLPAAVAYVALMLLVVVAAVRAVGERDTVGIGFGVAVVAYAGQQLVLFPVAELDPTFWLLAGTLTVSPTATDPARSPWQWLPSRAAATGAVAACAVVGATVVWSGAHEIAADRAAREAARSTGGAAVTRAGDAVALVPDAIRYRLLLADAHAARGTLEAMRAAISATDAAVERAPLDPVARRRAASLRLDVAVRTGDDGDVEAALDAYTGLVARQEFCQPCQLGLGYAAALAGDVDTAAAAFDAAAALSGHDDTRAADALVRLTALGDGGRP